MAGRRRGKRGDNRYKSLGVVEGPITVSGQRQNVRVERPTLLIEREEGTNIRLRRERGGTHRLIVEGGGQGHRPGPRPEPSQPRSFFDFERMVLDLDGRVAHVLNPGGEFRLEMKEKQAKAQPVFFKGGILTQLLDVKKGGVLFNSNWLALHPSKIVENLFSNLYKRARFGRDKRYSTRANALKRKYAPYAESLVERYIADSMEAVNALYREAEAGRVNWENRNNMFQQYKRALKIVERNYFNAVRVLEQAYMKEVRGKAAVTLSNSGVRVQNLGRRGRLVGKPVPTSFYPEREPARGLGERRIVFVPGTGAAIRKKKSA